MKLKMKTIEDYVELVYNIQKKKKRVQTNDVAFALNINPASVTEIFQKLSNEGYIDYEKYSGVKLTGKGKKIAVRTKNKHDTLKKFLVILGVSEEIADEDACKIEHSVNQETMEILRKFVEFARIEDGCSRWLDHFKYFDETGKYIKCSPRNEKNCPIHSK